MRWLKNEGKQFSGCFAVKTTDWDKSKDIANNPMIFGS